MVKTIFGVLFGLFLVSPSDAGLKFPAVYDGIDKDQNPCFVEVLSYSEQVDPNVKAEETQGPTSLFTNVKKTLQVQVSFQYNAADKLTLVSQYDSMWDQYEVDRISGQNKIGRDRREDITLYINPTLNSPKSLNYYREPKVTVLGIEFGEVENRCSELKLQDEEK